MLLGIRYLPENTGLAHGLMCLSQGLNIPTNLKEPHPIQNQLCGAQSRQE